MNSKNIDKKILTYNRQMKKLRDDKHIQCEGSYDKKILIRSGYFNLINGYKNPYHPKRQILNIVTFEKQKIKT